jgi:hypothetical protein
MTVDTASPADVDATTDLVATGPVHSSETTPTDSEVSEAERELAKLSESDPAMLALDARLSVILRGDQ